MVNLLEVFNKNKKSVQPNPNPVDAVNKGQEKKNKEKSAITISDEIKKDLSQYRKQFEKLADDERNAYNGQIWKETNEDRPFENSLFEMIESEVPILTDSQPGTIVRVDDANLQVRADNLTKAINWVYENQDWQLVLPIVVRDSLIDMPAWVFVYYDLNADDGDGQEIYEILPWKNVWVDGAVSFIEKASKAHFKVKRTRDWLMMTYPNFADHIASHEDKEYSEMSKGKEGREQVDTQLRARRKTPTEYSDRDLLTLEYTYKKDFTLEPIPQEVTQEELEEEYETLNKGESPDINKWQDHKAHIAQHEQEEAQLFAKINLPPGSSMEDAKAAVEMMGQQGQPTDDLNNIMIMLQLLHDHKKVHATLLKENPTSQRLKYENGYRVIERLGNIELYDGSNKHKHKQIPLVPFYCYKGRGIYGHGQIRNTLDSQRMQAVMAFKEYKGLQKVANPTILIDAETGLTDDDVTNEDGGIYTIPQGTNIRHLDPGNVSPQLSIFQQARISMIRMISGMTEATQGKAVSPMASGVTTEKLQTQAIGRIRMRDRMNQGYSIKRLGTLTASDIIQFWPNEKILGVDDGSPDKAQIIFDPMDYKDLQYKIDISEGSMAGVDKESFNGLLKNFVDTGKMSLGQFLQVADIPQKDKLIKLVGEQEQIQQQAQQMQGQMQEMQVQNAALKGAISPVLLGPEDQKAFDQVIIESAIQNIKQSAAGVNNNQSAPIEGMINGE